MSNEIIKIEELEKQVVAMTKFEFTKEQLRNKVAETSKIVATDLEDKNQLALVRRGRIDLRNMEIVIEKQGKSFRDIYTSANRKIKELENELLGVTGPEKERLLAIEWEAEVLCAKKERLALLPARKERLLTIDSNRDYDDNAICDMDDVSFATYCIEITAAKLEQEKVLATMKAAEAQAKLDAERQKLEEEKRALELEKAEALRKKTGRGTIDKS